MASAQRQKMLEAAGWKRSGLEWRHPDHGGGLSFVQACLAEYEVGSSPQLPTEMIAELSRLDYFEAMADRAWEMQLARADPSVAGGRVGSLVGADGEHTREPRTVRARSPQ